MSDIYLLQIGPQFDCQPFRLEPFSVSETVRPSLKLKLQNMGASSEGSLVAPLVVLRAPATVPRWPSRQPRQGTCTQ